MADMSPIQANNLGNSQFAAGLGKGARRSPHLTVGQRVEQGVLFFPAVAGATTANALGGAARAVRGIALTTAPAGGLSSLTVPPVNKALLRTAVATPPLVGVVGALAKSLGAATLAIASFGALKAGGRRPA